MKMSPEFVRAQQNMQPGVITADGFLGDERRALVKIIERDENLMQELGLRFDESADRLEYLIKAGQKGLGEPVTIENQWLVRTDEARGHLPSPFEDGIFRKVNASISLVDTPDSPTTAIIRVSLLSLHLMRKWHFLQGEGAPFRIEPRDLKYVLKM